MGIKDFFARWTKGEDARAEERVEDESRMTPFERDVDREDFEGRKDDIAASSRLGGDVGATDDDPVS